MKTVKVRWLTKSTTLTLPDNAQLSEPYRSGYEAGVRAAAEVAGTFDKHIAWPYRFEDTILYKFNLRRRRPRVKR